MTLLHTPDDGIISAYIDGAGEETDAAHIEGCETCRTRVAELRGVVAHVGGSAPAPDPARRDRAVAAALAARATAGRRRATMVVRRLRHPLVPAALAVITLIVLIPLLFFGDGDLGVVDPDGDSFVATADLGAIGDPAELDDAVDAGLEDGRAREALASAEELAAETRRARALPCEPEARTLAGGPARGPLLSARLTWLSRPAVAHAYVTGDRATDRRVYVLSQADCRLLADRRF